MSVDAPDDVPSSTRPQFDEEPTDDRGALASVVVQYDGNPDRRTLYPPAATEAERLTRWISADDDAFVRLDGVR